eukprot:TRINITY_DN13200_c0_g1_i2.p1 TRINITY_DN13200_c0_g1~~TRINITY_DN13200_c0_g1_i2.p1  ORF type:complete len:147 (-),score=9.19 TRINITY_DN13200_c0_g1_i2:75-515(-)
MAFNIGLRFSFGSLASTSAEPRTMSSSELAADSGLWSPPVAPQLKPSASDTAFEAVPLLELPPAAVTLSGKPRLTPSPDPFDCTGLPPWELPPSAVHLRSVRGCSPRRIPVAWWPPQEIVKSPGQRERGTMSEHFLLQALEQLCRD